jgi:hypothetical protein
MTKEEMKQELDRLNKCIKHLETELSKTENEPKFERLSHGEPYYYIYGNNMEVAVASDDSDYTSEVCYVHNNYFHTKKRAQEVAEKIKFLLRLERLHDIYCPNYKPNWEENDEHKYCVCYDGVDNKYFVDWQAHCIPHSDVFFPTEEIAQKACDILNEKPEEQDNS